MMKSPNNTISRLARGLARGLVCAMAMLVCTQLALATDRVTLRDGRVVEGEIARELNGSVWLRTADGLTQFFPASEVMRIERDVAADEEEAPASPGVTDPAPSQAQPARQTSQRRAVSPGAPRAAVITFGDADAGQDMVGAFVTANSFRNCIPLLEEENVEIVVIRINSGGGAVFELQGLSDVFHNEFKPRFRTVAWVDYAISAASLAPHTLEEHYFMRRGAYGGNTAFFGASMVAVAGRGLEDILYYAERASERGGHDPRIIRAMQILEPLSVDHDEHGRVTAMYQNDQGQIVINKPNRVLALTSVTAQQIGFAKGIADTLDELATAMGLTEVEWVGVDVEGVPYPVSKAEMYLRRFREQTARDQMSINQYFDGYTVAVELARQTEPGNRGKFIGFARRNLNSIIRMVDNNPNLALFIMGFSEEDFRIWAREQEQLLRDLAR